MQIAKYSDKFVVVLKAEKHIPVLFSVALLPKPSMGIKKLFVVWFFAHVDVVQCLSLRGFLLTT